VLSVRHRLRHPADFSAVLRHGSRAGREALVVHLLLDDGQAGAEPLSAPVLASAPARVGFVVPRAVGNAVIRNHVTRRLRALSAARIDRLEGFPPGFPPGSRVVIRALPTAGDTSYAALESQLDAALATAVRRAGSKVST
jgi:ribonuclease P protein component